MATEKREAEVEELKKDEDIQRALEQTSGGKKEKPARTRRNMILFFFNTAIFKKQSCKKSGGLISGH